MLQLGGTREELNDRLNELGAEGWEAVRTDYQRWTYLKRVTSDE